MQLLQAGDIFLDTIGNRTIRHHEVFDAFGVRAEQIVDFLALAGDSVDNIPGAPGVGPKTASALLGHFDSIDELYDNLDRVSEIPVRGAGKLASKLTEHKDKVMISKDLATIRCDAPMEVSNTALTRQPPDLEALNTLYDEIGFGDGLRAQARRIYNSF